MIGLLCAYLRRRHQTAWIAVCYAEPFGSPTWIVRTYDMELARARRLRVALLYALLRPAATEGE